VRAVGLDVCEDEADEEELDDVASELDVGRVLVSVNLRRLVLLLLLLLLGSSLIRLTMVLAGKESGGAEEDDEDEDEEEEDDTVDVDGSERICI
jgi:uncharacterized membrane protein